MKNVFEKLMNPYQPYVTESSNFIGLYHQLVPRKSPNSILTNKGTVGCSRERTSQLMFYEPLGTYEKVVWWFLGLF